LRTLGSFALALQVQGAVTPDGSLGGGSLINLVLESTPVAKAVLAILIIFSISSWGVILYKWWLFRRVESFTKKFLDIFRRSTKFSEVQAVCRTLDESPLVGIFQAGYAELNNQLRQPAAPAVHVSGSNPAAAVGRPTLKSLQAVDRALLRASTVEINKLEKYVGFLATTASVTPFIGLFGTVVGIIVAFQGIASTGSTNLAVVAPGIADALIATAAGLAAAIPAVVFYNGFVGRVKRFGSEMDDFSLEFLNIAERNFT
jgi:biopolymer transport protein TolQ